MRWSLMCSFANRCCVPVLIRDPARRHSICHMHSCDMENAPCACDGDVLNLPLRVGIRGAACVVTHRQRDETATGAGLDGHWLLCDGRSDEFTQPAVSAVVVQAGVPGHSV